MSVSILKPTVIVNTALALLERELTLPALVWNDPVGDFAGAKDDTISIRLPAYAVAKNRALRSGDSRDRDKLAERKVDVTLDTDIYKDVIISDEQLSLDITDFGTQVLNPVMSAIARALEDTLWETIRGATYENDLQLDMADPYNTFVDARKALNDARVPFSGRSLIVGSTVEAAVLKSAQFARADHTGPATSESAVREAQIGRIAGFDVYTSPVVDPDEAYAFHKTAFVLSSRAPIVPAGAPYGASASSKGFAVRVVRVLDPQAIEDILATDSWVGTNVVTDHGSMDEDGRFIPSETSPDDSSESESSGEQDLLVRAVRMSNDGSSSDDES